MCGNQVRITWMLIFRTTYMRLVDEGLFEQVLALLKRETPSPRSSVGAPFQVCRKERIKGKCACVRTGIFKANAMVETQGLGYRCGVCVCVVVVVVGGGGGRGVGGRM